ncbi:MAG: GNAT family N-acetyltransferase [Terriglobales bacterium]
MVASALAVPAAWEAGWWADRDWSPLLPDWRVLHSRLTPNDLETDPEWCRAIEAADPGTVRLLVLRRSGAVAAVVPALVKRGDLDCNLGELRLAHFRPWLVELPSALAQIVDDNAACSALFTALLQPPPSLHRLDGVRVTAPVASPLWAFLTGPELARPRRRRYAPSPPQQHHVLRLPPSFAAYTAKFSPKTRKNRERELRHLERRGTLELVPCRAAGEIEAFLQEAWRLSGRSYQHKLLRSGLRPPAQLRHRLQVAAERGWLRSYLLRCGGVSCSFMLGYQYGNHYYYTKVGYDPAWAALSVGTVLQWLVLQDLYARDRPELIDFGVQGPQKRYFGNDQFEEGSLCLFRPGWYPWLACASHRRARRLTAAASRWLGRYRLKAPAQRWLRRLSGC